MDKLARDFIKYCGKNNLAKVNKCLSLGVDVNTVNESEDYNAGQTALMIACKNGCSSIVSRLVQVPGLDINYSETDGGYTAAHLACYNGHLDGSTECVVILAETGRVDWNKRDSEGKTPLHMGLDDNIDDIINIISKQPNIDYNVRTKDGKTLAQIAVDGPDAYVETFASLETFDCWNVPDKDGNTPIMWALKNRYGVETVKILLRCPRVDLSLRDKEGWSLVFRAIQFVYFGEKMVKTLQSSHSNNLCF